jgi:hypothetical protein
MVVVKRYEMVDWDLKITNLVGEISEQCAAENEPLGGDEVEFIARLFWLKLDLSQGNITETEFSERMNCIEKGKTW